MIREYLRMRRTLFLLWAAAGVTSLASAAAYGAGMEAAQYGLLMLTFLLALFCAADFLRFRARARRLDEVLRNLSEARHSLPEAVGPIEARYHALADGLYALLAAQKEALETGPCRAAGILYALGAPDQNPHCGHAPGDAKRGQARAAGSGAV